MNEENAVAVENEVVETTSEVAVAVVPAVVTPVVTKRNSPDAETFCRVWNASETRQEVVQRLTDLGYNAQYGAVVTRGNNYRKKGIPLKEMPAGQRGRRLDVAALTAVLNG